MPRRLHEVVGPVVAQPQRGDGRIDRHARRGPSLREEVSRPVHIVVELPHARFGHEAPCPLLAGPEHELEEVDAPRQLVVDDIARRRHRERFVESREALAESPLPAVDMRRGRSQARELRIAAVPNLRPDDIDARHLHPAQAAEGVTLHLHAPGQHIILVHVGDVAHAVGLAPLRLRQEIAVGEEAAPHIPEIRLHAALHLAQRIAVHRGAVALDQCAEPARGVVALLPSEHLENVARPRHPLEGRFIAAESQYGGAEVMSQRPAVLLVRPTDKLAHGRRVEVIAERVGLVLSAGGVVHAARLRRPPYRLYRIAVGHQRLHAQVRPLFGELAPGHAAGIFSLVDNPHVHAAAFHRIGHHAHIGEPLRTEVVGPHVIARFDDDVAEALGLNLAEVTADDLGGDFSVPPQNHVAAHFGGRGFEVIFHLRPHRHGSGEQERYREAFSHVSGVISL